MEARPTQWFSLVLPREPFPHRIEGCRLVTAETDEGLDLFAATQARAYGETATEQDRALLLEDLEDGALERDKTLVLLHEGEAVGSISYLVLPSPSGTPVAHLSNVGVPEEFQGRGYGAQTFRSVLNRLLHRQGPGVRVLTDVYGNSERSVRIVAQLGFEAIPREDWFPPDVEDLLGGGPP